MKRKKWSELEEQTLLNKYSDLNNSGVLAKLKTREKKFKPVADHVNSIHHLQDPLNFPFKWCWRDVSIKVQNMRHQYLGVKQKIKLPNNEFNWKDGENHWENFIKYKEVFGDVELSEAKDHNNNHSDFVSNVQKIYCNGMIGDEGVMGTGFPMDSEEFEEEEDEEEEDEEREMSDEGEKEEMEDSSIAPGRKMRKGISGRRLRIMGGQVFELGDSILKREERRREREEMEMREIEFEQRRIVWARRESERRAKEFDEEKQRKIKFDEKFEEEEMEWREKMMAMQIDHERRMVQMHADACQNQIQVLGIMARLLCQFFGSANDGLTGTLPPQDLQNLHHSDEGLDGGVKPEANSPSQFL